MIDVYGELAEPSRRLILAELRGGPKTVTELVEATGLKQPNVSNHLAKMRHRGTVRATKVGRQVYYTLSSPQVHAVVVTAFVEPTKSETEDLTAAANVYAQLAADGHEAQCSRLVDQAVSDGHSLLSIFQDLMVAALGIVHEWRNTDRIDSAQLLIAYSIVERSIARVSHMTAPKRRSDDSAILGCTRTCRHSLDVRMVGEYLRSLGWRVYFLGESAPTDAFVTAARRLRPQFIVIGAGYDGSIAETADLVKRLRSWRDACPIGIASSTGCDDEQLADVMGLKFYAKDIRDFAVRCLPMLCGATAEP